MQKISVVLPCYNEKDNILPLVKQIHEVLLEWPHEIIVVDDNSPDGTYQYICEQSLDYVLAFKREIDPSLGKAIRYGIEKATGDIIVMMDSDFNHQPKELPVLIANLKFFDCVIGSRFVYGGNMPNRLRLLASWIFNVVVRLLTRHFVTDSLYGFVAIKRETLEKLDFDNIFWGYGDYCIRLLFYLQENKISILQVPSVLGERPTGQGNSRFIRTLLLYSKETLKLVFKGKRK